MGCLPGARKSYKKIIVLVPVLLILVALTLIIFNKCEKDEKTEKIQEAVMFELSHYPEASLVDLYKNFFQDAYGPGHLIPDTSGALNYLRYELDNAGEFDTTLWQSLGYQNNFYRINLLLIKEKKIPFNEFFTAFVESANSVCPPSIEKWRKEWDFILNVIDNMDLNIKNYHQDKEHIDSLLSDEKYMIHHSEHYINKYNPHYRIVSKNHFKRLSKYFR